MNSFCLSGVSFFLIQIKRFQTGESNNNFSHFQYLAYEN